MSLGNTAAGTCLGGSGPGRPPVDRQRLQLLAASVCGVMALQFLWLLQPRSWSWLVAPVFCLLSSCPGAAVTRVCALAPRRAHRRMALHLGLAPPLASVGTTHSSTRSGRLRPLCSRSLAREPPAATGTQRVSLPSQLWAPGGRGSVPFLCASACASALCPDTGEVMRQADSRTDGFLSLALATWVLVAHGDPNVLFAW